MLLCAEYILPITSEPIEEGAVLVRDGKICDIGSADLMLMRYPQEEVHDYGQAAIMPGFVDIHTHLEYSAMRGIVRDMPYTSWIMAVNDVAGRLSNAELRDSAILGGLEALSAGITCVADITTTDAAVHALQVLGLRGVIYRETGAMDKRRVDYAMKLAKTDIARWAGRVDSDRISIGIAPSALYSCHPSIFKRISEYSRQENLPVAMHLAGSQEEFNFIKYGSSAFSVDSMRDKRGFVEIPPWLPTGVTPVNYALNWGAFETDNVMAVHCVHVDDEDIQKLKAYDVAVATCPRCNAQLGMGVAPLNEFMRADLRIGLGTDSPAAADSTDMLAEMRIGMLVQRAVNVNEFLPARVMLEMATIGGAKVLHLDDKIGSLDIGKLADIVAIDISGSHQTPTSDPVSAVVNTSSGTDVLMSMVGGTILYEQNQWHIDVEVAKNIAHVIEIRSKLRA